MFFEDKMSLNLKRKTLESKYSTALYFQYEGIQFLLNHAIRRHLKLKKDKKLKTSAKLYQVANEALKKLKLKKLSYFSENKPERLWGELVLWRAVRWLGSWTALVAAIADSGWLALLSTNLRLLPTVAAFPSPPVCCISNSIKKRPENRLRKTRNQKL